jgi:hypothetical protein
VSVNGGTHADKKKKQAPTMGVIVTCLIDALPQKVDHDRHPCVVSFTPGFSQVAHPTKSTGNRLNSFQSNR